jgi:integrase
MALWKRGPNGIWYYGFAFAGRYYQGSSYSKSKTMARDAMLARRRELEKGINGVARQERVLSLKVVAERWLETKSTSAKATSETARDCLKPLIAEFGSRLASDISARDIGSYQRRRLAAVSASTVNHEVGILRQVLKAQKLWRNIQDDVKMLKEQKGPGKAVSVQDEERIIEAISRGRSSALLPMFMIAIDTGLRADELRNLRHRDLNLTWSKGVVESGWLTVSKSKTDAGTGRVIPLTRRACAALSLWLSSRAPDADMNVIREKIGPEFLGPSQNGTSIRRRRIDTPSADSYLFPAHKVGVRGDSRASYAYDFNPKQAIGDWGKAWDGALARATEKLEEELGEGAPTVKYRWHDLRHTFITRLLENPAVSEQTVMALAGHVSKEMLARYSHIRAAAKQAAIATLERVDLGQGTCSAYLQAPNDESEPIQPDANKYLN